MLYYWLPVLIWLGVIFTESMSRYAASDQTSRIIVPLLHWLMPWLNPLQLEQLHDLVRKVGHFTGYGLLSYFFFRGFRGTHLIRQGGGAVLTRTRAAFATVRSESWRGSWALLAMAGTFLTAAADETHQMTLPYRGGSWWDVLLDCVGGAIFQLLILLFWTWRASQKKGVPARVEA